MRPKDTPLVLTGVHQGRRYRLRLPEGSHTLGSLPENRLCLKVSGVSRRHAVIRRVGERLTIEDLASKNGVYVNGEKALHAPLALGDRLRLGSITLTVEETCIEDARLAVRLDDLSPEDQAPLGIEPEETTGLRPSPADSASTPETESEFDPGSESGSDDQLTDDRFGQTTGAPHAEAAPPWPPELDFPADWLPGRSPAMRTLFQEMRAVTRSTLPVLVLGETGTGKEGVARTVHRSSARSDGPFIAINCSAIPAELLESELFGVGAGVATGVTARSGRFVEATGGTLFLDEIGDMPASLQVKLLRALEEREIRPLGERPRSLDVRVVSATHTDLSAAITDGRFRRDLFFRLAGVTLGVPPLRARREDIPDLVRHFMAEAAKAARKSVRGLTHEAMQRIVDHPWPGNVRQLRHAVERWIHRCPNHQVVDDELVRSDFEISPFTDQITPVTRDQTDPMAATEDDAFDPTDLASLNLAEIERRVLREALRRSGGNRTHAADALGLSRQALRRRLVRHDLRDE